MERRVGAVERQHRGGVQLADARRGFDAESQRRVHGHREGHDPRAAHAIRVERLDREVAVKVIGKGRAEDPSARSRFEREARAVAALSHPNILAIHDIGTHEGQPYIVEELLEGESLRERLKSGALPGGKAAESPRSGSGRSAPPGFRSRSWPSVSSPSPSSSVTSRRHCRPSPTSRATTTHRRSPASWRATVRSSPSSSRSAAQ